MLRDPLSGLHLWLKRRWLKRTASCACAFIAYRSVAPKTQQRRSQIPSTSQLANSHTLFAIVYPIVSMYAIVCVCKHIYMHVCLYRRTCLRSSMHIAQSLKHKCQSWGKGLRTIPQTFGWGFEGVEGVMEFPWNIISLCPVSKDKKNI